MMQRILSSARLFRKENNLVPVSFEKREDTGDESVQKKWDDFICLVWIRDE